MTDAEAHQASLDAALIRAVESGDGVRTRALIGQGAFVGPETLAAAIRAGHSEIVGVLLDAGADPRAADAHGVMPIFVAAAAGHPALREFLADPDRADPSRWPPHAITFAHGEILWMLLDRGAAANARIAPRATPTAPGLTPLMVAAAFGHTAAVDILIARGGNPRALDAAGRTAKDWADRMGQRATSERLKSFGKS
jgi:ankyrin repeat protein